jgi:hypothetical protein
VALKIEESYDRLVHHRLPVLVTEKLPRACLKLQTESENLLYVGAYLMAIILIVIGFALS